MNINLCYIHGISRIDTPYFVSPSEQQSYFEDRIVSTIDTTFYHPHYKNVIRFESSDIDVNDTINYLYFTYKEKDYYYFIDKITYSSEDVIELSITMDYIQTYMFNIYVADGVIERKHINRYVLKDNRYVINRDYIRENLSSGIFTPAPKNYVETRESYERKLWVVVLLTEDYGRHYVTYINTPSGKVSIPYRLVTFPLCKFTKFYLGSSEQNIYDLVSYFLKKKSPYIADAFVVYGCPIGPSYYVDSDYYLHAPSDANMEDMEVPLVGGTSITISTVPIFAPDYQFVAGPTANNIDIKEGTITQRINDDTSVLSSYYHSKAEFTRSVTVDTYDSEYIPQMCDENYLRIKYGTPNAVSTLPLYPLEIYNFYFNFTYDYVTGVSYYYMRFGYDSDVFPIPLYNYIETDCNILSYPIIIDSGSEYIANNRNRWATAGLKAGLGIAQSFVNVAVGAGLAKSSLHMASNSIETDDYNEITAGSIARLRTAELGMRQAPIRAGGDIANGVLGAIGEVIQTGQREENAEYAPDTVKQVSNISFSMNANMLYRYCTVEKVNDYEAVAHWYHRNGYKVNEQVVNVSDIFTYAQNRRLFNILKFLECNVHLNNVIEDQESVQRITKRLTDGIRLWNVEYNILEQGIDQEWSITGTLIGVHVFTLTFNIPAPAGWTYDRCVAAGYVTSEYYWENGVLTIKGLVLYGQTLEGVVTVVFKKTETLHDIGDYSLDNLEINL